MKTLHQFFVAILLISSLCACGDMLRSLRQESLAADGDEASEEDAATSYKPKRLNGLSANNTASLEAPVKRSYGRGLASFDNAKKDMESTAAAAKRYTKDDFIDKNPAENSLWDGQGQSNYLFTNNRTREVGDLVTADVDHDLKREIQYALWMNLPVEQRKPRKLASAGPDAGKTENKAIDAANKVASAADSAKTSVEKGKDAAEEAAKTNMQSTGKEDDIVRMEVAEQMGGGLVKLVGNKRVIYRGQSRVVEVVALANAKDIDDSGRIKSSAFIDKQTQVIQ